MKNVANGRFLPNTSYSTSIHMCEETTVGGERTNGGISAVGVGEQLCPEKQLGSLGIPDLNCVSEGEGESGEGGKEQKTFSINDLV